MTEPRKKYKTLNLAMDILSFIFIAALFVGFPVWGHYYSNSRDANGYLVMGLKLMFADGPLFVFGIFWLGFRHGARLAKQYPLFFDNPRPRYKALFVTIFLTLYLAGYLILKNTLWR
jgi:biotin transporter BioY